MTWQYKGEDFNPEFPIEAEGFVYRIFFKDGDGVIHTYYGKKSFWKTKTLQPLKGYKRKRKSLVESDWRTYLGSCKDTKGYIPIKKEILRLANDKYGTTYWENYYLFIKDTLFDPRNLNQQIGGKFYRDNIDIRRGEWTKWYDKIIKEKDEQE